MKSTATAALQLAMQRSLCDVIEIYEGDLETALIWFLTPLPSLNGLRPVDCAVDNKKIGQLEAVIRTLSNGEFP